jgi:hypothetical protein
LKDLSVKCVPVTTGTACKYEGWQSMCLVTVADRRQGVVLQLGCWAKD